METLASPTFCTFNLRVTRNISIRADCHFCLFSADSDYLYIPNKYAPNFDIVGALRAKDEYKNPLPKIELQPETILYIIPL